jgi:hypothetical protein
MEVIMNENNYTSPKRRIGLSIGEATLDLCDKAKKKGYARTRSDFIDDAVKMYSTWLGGKNYTKFIVPAYESVVEGIVNNGLNKVSRNLFKLSVEVCMLMRAIAYAYELDDNQLAEIRKECIKEVSELNGTIHLEDWVNRARNIDE